MIAWKAQRKILHVYLERIIHMKKPDLLQEPIQNLFISYLLPSISATLVTSIYILADTIMIGKGIGSLGIAALNIILPIFNLFFGFGMLFGVGGSVLMSVCHGKGDVKTGQKYFTSAFLTTITLGFSFALLGNLFLRPLVYLLGATDTIIELTISYGRYVMTGAPIFMMSSLLQAFVRNDKAPRLAMIAVIVGGVSNVLLDYIFIFPLKMGIGGAAAASVIGVSITVFILCLHFLSKDSTIRLIKDGFSLSLIKDILCNGFSSFLLEMANGIVIFLFNLQLIRYVGEIGVVVYGIISNSSLVAISLSNGIAQAAQPIIATNFGARLWQRVNIVRKLGLLTAFIIGTLLFLSGLLYPKYIIQIFINPTSDVISMAIPAIRIYFLAFIPSALNIFFCNYFQGIINPSRSLIICLLRGVILCTIFIFIFPKFWGVTGIWAVVPTVEFVTLFVSFFFIEKSKKSFES